MRVTPEKVVSVGLAFAKVIATGSKIPTLELDQEGANITFPDGSRHPLEPVKPGLGTIEEVDVYGFITIILEFCGTPMTFPFGARIRPLNPDFFPIDIFELARVYGLYCITLELPGLGAMTLPLGKRTAPDCLHVP
jgi:hypothetical protein